MIEKGMEVMTIDVTNVRKFPPSHHVGKVLSVYGDTARVEFRIAVDGEEQIVTGSVAIDLLVPLF